MKRKKIIGEVGRNPSVRWRDRLPVRRLLLRLRRTRKDLLVAALLGFVATALLSPLQSNEFFPSTGEIGNHMGFIVQAKTALDEGQFPIRIAPFQHHGWRYPAFQFYSPFPYIVGALAMKWLAPQNPLIAFKAVMWLALFCGGFTLGLHQAGVRTLAAIDFDPRAIATHKAKH